MKVFLDVLGDYQTEASYQKRSALASGGHDWEQLLKVFDIDTVINSRENVFFTNNTPVYQLKNWRLIYVSDSASVWARQDIVKNTALDLSYIHPKYPGEKKFNQLEWQKSQNQLQDLLARDENNIFA